MKGRTVLLFAVLVYFVTIALAEQKIVRKTTQKQLQKKAITSKGLNIQKSKTTATTKKKKKKKSTKSTTSSVGGKSGKSIFTTIFDESAPDSERGIDCYDACYPNSTFLNSAGKIKDPSLYGKITDKYCGKTYLFGTKKVSWEQNWKICCSIGMMPLIFDNKKEWECLVQEIEDDGGSITQGKTFWTGGFKHELQGTWSWCTKDTPVPLEEMFIQEMPGGGTTSKPVKGERKYKSEEDEMNCIQMNVESKQLDVNKCDVRANFLACESVEKLALDLLPNTTCKAKCNAHESCTRNSTLFKLNEKHEMELMDRYKYGRWAAKCGRYFLFSTRTATYAEAHQKCCSFGTKLLSIKTAAKMVCLTSFLKDYPDVAGEYWTSGTDAGCDGNFRWCSVDRAFLKKQVKWAPGEPDRKKGDCAWMSMKMPSREIRLHADNCQVKKKFVCEVRQSGKTVEAVQKECVELIGLRQDEVDRLNNTGNYTYNMKCYLRCIGDNLGMLINGTLQEGNVMKLMEDSNEQGDMDKGYDAIDKCKQCEDKTDDCESAYQIYSCGKKEAPVVFGKMVVWEEVNSDEETAPVNITVPRDCPLQTKNPCTLTKNLQLGFAAQNSTPEGGVAVVGWNGKIWYKSQFNESHSYENAYSYCCALGMYLPTFTTTEEFQKLYDFMNGSNTDNFYGETQSTGDGSESWCRDLTIALPPEVSLGGFKLLSEMSILYSKKDFHTKYKLIAIRTSQIANRARVNHFYCEPTQ